MKQHKDKDVWAHRPDALPIPDAPSTGARRKKGKLEKASKKHLWDLLRQGEKDIRLKARWLYFHPAEVTRSWFNYEMTDWTCKDIAQACAKMDEVLRELERRME